MTKSNVQGELRRKEYGDTNLHQVMQYYQNSRYMSMQTNYVFVYLQKETVICKMFELQTSYRVPSYIPVLFLKFDTSLISV